MRGLSILAGIQRRVPWGVALTFDGDDLPVLDRLRDLEARATFFVEIGTDPEVIRRMRDEGHGVGSRSRALTPESIEAAVVDVQLALGKRSRLFRPAPDQLDVRAALAMRRARLDSWLWRTDDVHDVRERDVVRVPLDLDAATRVVESVRAKGLDLVAL